MKRNKLFTMLLVVVMAVMSVSGCSSNGDAAGKTSTKGGIKLGVLAPLTGDVSVYGIAVNNGIKLAMEEINKNGGVLGQQIALETLDEKGDISEAVTAYNKLLTKDVVALLGDVTSKPSIAVAELAAKDKMPMLTPTGTAAAITTYGDNIFRTCFIDPFQGKIMATFASEKLKAKNVAIMYNTSDDYSQGVAKAFAEKAKELGITVVANEGYGADDKDFRTQLTKIQALNPDALFLPDYTKTVALIATQAREIGYTKPLLGADGWDGVLTALDASNKKAVDNSYFSNHYSTTDTEKIQRYAKRLCCSWI
jgi:branched-chain amino acid transport system substrate-binding protein